MGVIEGFYGKPWSPGARLAMADWLPALGLDLYLYAPKQDVHLRRQWHSDWPADQRSELTLLAERCGRRGLSLYIGLSPFALYEDYGPPERAQLQQRVRQIEDLGVAGLALLFDDMPGDCPDLALRQAEIAADVMAVSALPRLLVCPTYYSDDPVLDRFFGPRPERYLASLGDALPASAALLWTGPQVCSERIDAADLPEPPARGNRSLALWDNYPVNDSKLRSPHLYLDPLSGRSAGLAAVISGHYCNAMNQPALSLPALSSLATLYGRGSPQASEVLAEAGVTETLCRACLPLAEKTLAELSSTELRALEVQAEGGSMASAELSAFLRGDYRFDPACLTD